MHLDQKTQEILKQIQAKLKALPRINDTDHPPHKAYYQHQYVLPAAENYSAQEGVRLVSPSGDERFIQRDLYNKIFGNPLPEIKDAFLLDSLCLPKNPPSWTLEEINTLHETGFFLLNYRPQQ